MKIQNNAVAQFNLVQSEMVKQPNVESASQVLKDDVVQLNSNYRPEVGGGGGGTIPPSSNVDGGIVTNGTGGGDGIEPPPPK